MRFRAAIWTAVSNLMDQSILSSAVGRRYPSTRGAANCSSTDESLLCRDHIPGQICSASLLNHLARCHAPERLKRRMIKPLDEVWRCLRIFACLGVQCCEQSLQRHKVIGWILVHLAWLFHCLASNDLALPDCRAFRGRMAVGPFSCPSRLAESG